MRRRVIGILVASFLAACPARSQELLMRPYRAPRLPAVQFRNSNRLFELLRAGQLYLSLSDAIALAVENSLDIELERVLPRIASTEVQRAEGGGLLRGLSLLVTQPAPGIGGPNGPLLTNLTSSSTPSPLVNTNFSDLALITQQQNDLSTTGTLPLATGPAIPQFDPAVSGLLDWSHASSPQTTTVLTGGSNWLASNTTTGNLGYTQGLSWGTQIEVGFVNDRLTTNASRYTYLPSLNSSLGINITQPLLRGFGRNMNRRFIRIAKNNQNVADRVFRQQLIETVAGVARLYTDLVSLKEDVKVKLESLRLAERLYKDNQDQVGQGTLAPIEVTRAQAQVAASRQALITAEGLVRQQELVVITAITRRGLADPAIRSAQIAPTDSVPEPDQGSLQPIQDLIGDALRERPDLAAAGLQVESSQISLEGSRNAVKPQVDIVSALQNGGLSGSPTDPTAPTVGAVFGGYGTALGQIFRRNYPTYGIGLQVTLPLRNRVALADAARDQLQVRQTLIRRQQLEDQVRLEVEDAQMTMEQARAAYAAAQQTRVLQEQSVDVEQQKYAVGLSTNLQVIQFQSFLAQARSTEVAAKGAYAKAKIALARATGRILTDYNVSVDDAYKGQMK